MVQSDSECMSSLGTLKTNYENAWRNITASTQQIADLKEKIGECSDFVKTVQAQKRSDDQKLVNCQKEVGKIKGERDLILKESGEGTKKQSELTQNISQKDKEISDLKHTLQLEQKKCQSDISEARKVCQADNYQMTAAKREMYRLRQKVADKDYRIQSLDKELQERSRQMEIQVERIRAEKEYNRSVCGPFLMQIKEKDIKIQECESQLIHGPSGQQMATLDQCQKNLNFTNFSLAEAKKDADKAK